MARLLVFLLALATLGYLGYYAMYRAQPGDATQLPPERLKNVREAAQRIEVETQQRADDVVKKLDE